MQSDRLWLAPQMVNILHLFTLGVIGATFVYLNTLHVEDLTPCMQHAFWPLRLSYVYMVLWIVFDLDTPISLLLVICLPCP